MTTDLERKPARGSRTTGGKAGDEPVGKPAGEPTAKAPARKKNATSESTSGTPVSKADAPPGSTPRTPASKADAPPGSTPRTPASREDAPSGSDASPGPQPGKAEPGKAEPGKARPGKAKAEAKPKPADMPLWERIVGAIGALLVLAVLGLLVYDGVQPASPPALTLAVADPAPQPGGYLVTVDATNIGAATAAQVTVEGTLTDPAQPGGEPVETSQFTLDYIPDHATRRGGLFFTHEPAAYTLEVRVLGYSEP